METLITSITEGQKKQYLRFVEDAAERTLKKTGLDKNGLQTLIEHGDEFQAEISRLIGNYLRGFVDEEVESSYGYLSGYTKPKGITEQVNILRQLIPDIGFADEKLAEQPLPDNAEGWFAIPRWQSIAKTYEEALQKVLDLIKQQRGIFFSHREGQLGAKYLRRLERTAEKLEALGEQQKGYDILVVAAQFGLRHRGRSVRRAREVFMANEFGLGAFEIACMILTHQDRLADHDDLWIDCAGDEHASDGGDGFSGAPSFIIINRVGFISDWVGCAHRLSGSASAFLP
ncbi:MAG: hypothetical protein PHO90_02460 [Candidatus Pacebacteria bacterium]|nr:hypothetical protein [Candidatus Paceibacterota bacterium]